VQAGQVTGVARDGAAPETDVDVALPGGRLALDPQRVHGDRGGQAVQRHVHDRGDPARGGGPGGGGEALPFGTARLVDVHMGVDQAGQQRRVAQIPVIGGVQDRVVGLDRDDASLGHHDRGGPLTVRGDGPS
jgi:hypothetical protein